MTQQRIKCSKVTLYTVVSSFLLWGGGCFSLNASTAELENLEPLSQSEGVCAVDVQCLLENTKEPMLPGLRARIERARRNTMQTSYNGEPSASAAFLRLDGHPMALLTYHQTRTSVQDFGPVPRDYYVSDVEFVAGYHSTQCGVTPSLPAFRTRGAHVVASGDYLTDWVLLELTPPAGEDPFPDLEGMDVQQTPLHTNPDESRAPWVFSTHHMFGMPTQWWAGRAIGLGPGDDGIERLTTLTWSGDIGGGASGAPVMNLITGKLVGIHNLGSTSYPLCERTDPNRPPVDEVPFERVIQPWIWPFTRPTAAETPPANQPPFVIIRAPSRYNYVVLNSGTGLSAEAAHVESAEDARSRCTSVDGTDAAGTFQVHADVVDADGINPNSVISRVRYGLNGLEQSALCSLTDTPFGSYGLRISCTVFAKKGLLEVNIQASDTANESWSDTIFVCVQ